MSHLKMKMTRQMLKEIDEISGKAKKKPSEIFWEKYREAYGNPTVAGAYPDIGMDMKVLLLVLDEQFEREGNK